LSASKTRKALEQIKAEKKERAKTYAKDEAKKKSEPKASLTGPEARIMRFPDRAIRLGYDAQVAAAPREAIILDHARSLCPAGPI
jgi:hypothetical protein